MISVTGVSEASHPSELSSDLSSFDTLQFFRFFVWGSVKVSVSRLSLFLRVFSLFSEWLSSVLLSSLLLSSLLLCFFLCLLFPAFFLCSLLPLSSASLHDSEPEPTVLLFFFSFFLFFFLDDFLEFFSMSGFKTILRFFLLCLPSLQSFSLGQI